MSLRQLHPYPVWTHVLFAASFVGFLLFVDRLSRDQRLWLWVWSGVQVILGLILFRLRKRSRIRIYRCTRCERAVPSDNH